MDETRPGAAAADQSAGEVSTADTVQDARIIQEAFDGFDEYEMQDTQDVNKEEAVAEAFRTSKEYVVVQGFKIPKQIVTPGTAAFDKNVYSLYLKELNEEQIKEEAKTACSRAKNTINEALQLIVEIGRKTTFEAAAADPDTQSIFSGISASMNRDAAKIFYEAYNYLDMQEWKEEANHYNKLYQTEIKPVLPFLEKEAERLHEKPGLEWVTVDDLIKLINLDGTTAEFIYGKPIDPAIQTALERAKKNAKIAMTREKMEKAKERGALLPIGNLPFYSDDLLKDALTSNSIYRLPGTAENYVFDQAGKLNMLSLKEKPLEGLTELHEAALASVLGLALSAYETNWQPELDSVEIYLPYFYSAHKIDPRPFSGKRGQESSNLQELRRNHFLDLIAPFDNLVGSPDGGKSFYRIMALLSYDEETEVAKIATPYLFRLAEIKDTRLNRLLHPDVINEKDEAAVELASRILNGLLRRGRTRPDYRTYKNQKPKRVSKETVYITNPDGSKQKIVKDFIPEQELIDIQDPPQQQRIFTYEQKYSTLLADCPQISWQLEQIEKSQKPHRAQAYNSRLKQVFEAAYRIIWEKSDVRAYFDNITFHDVTTDKNGNRKIRVPTKSVLNTAKLKITHTGKPRL